MIQRIKSFFKSFDDYVKINREQIKIEKNLTRLLSELINRNSEMVELNRQFLSKLTEFLAHDRKIKLEQLKLEQERETAIKGTKWDEKY